MGAEPVYSSTMPTPRGADRLLVVAASALGALFAARAAALLWHPLPVDYGEGTTWSYTSLLSTHGTYFLPIQAAPYIHGTYPPLFPALHEALGGTLFAGRALSLLAAFGAALLFAAILRALGLARPRALFWSVVFLATPSVHEWSALLRVDMLALALSLGGVAIATRYAGQRGELLAAPVLALALFAKQVAVAAPLAVAVSLWLRGERRRLGWFLLLYLDLVLAGLGWLYYHGGAEAFRHLVTYAGFVGLSKGPLAHWGLRFLFTFPVLLPLGLAGLGHVWRTPAGVYAVVALLTLLMAGKPGAAANYLLEPSAGVVLLGALAAERRREELSKQPERRRDFTLLLLVQMVVICEPGRPLEVREIRRPGGAAARAVLVLRAAPGPVLSEDLGLTLAAGKEPMLEPFQFALLARAGRFDPGPLLKEVRDGRFAVIVSGARLRALPGFEQALAAGYRLEEETPPYQIWRPR